MLLGFAVTEHCNLRCPHCIRDDVTTVRNLDVDLIARTVDDAVAMWGDVTVSMTGGEPTIHPQWNEIIALLAARGVPYRFVSNGWHMRRLMPGFDKHPPQAVRLSLSGATAEVHDEERGRGSFNRVLLAVAMLTSRRIPSSLSIVVDRRDRHQLREAADLAEALGCIRIHFILPQPVIGSVERDSDLPPEEWMPVRREIQAIAAEPGRRTIIQLDYGGPQDGEEVACDTFSLQRVYVDARGRLSTCCQLSEYGFNEADVVADLNDMPLRDAWPLYTAAIDRQRLMQQKPADGGDAFDAFPCIRCARSCGKMEWIAQFPDSPWVGSAYAHAGPTVPLVSLRYRRAVPA
ncbi:MAG TPA: radical SAM protein [Longimicrobiaceae bacterium]|nr:radical SAM protein [Longimicrobiaceae bacterium]